MYKTLIQLVLLVILILIIVFISKKYFFNEDKIRSNIKLNCTIEQICENAVLIQESIVEDLKVKQDVYKELDRLTSKETILASSSSYLVISEISKYVEHKIRCINAHPALPPHVVPFV